jgi:multiple sugar transport system permease protein
MDPVCYHSLFDHIRYTGFKEKSLLYGIIIIMNNEKLKKIVVTVSLLLLAFIFLFPFLWLLSTSLKPLEQTMSIPPIWIPRSYSIIENGEKIKVIHRGHVDRIENGVTYYQVTEKLPEGAFDKKQRNFIRQESDIQSRIKFEFRNFITVTKTIPFFLYLRNTLIVCLLGVLGVLISNSLVAYGFSKIKWRGRDTFFYISLATMMIPFPVTMIPLFTVFKKLSMTGTLMPLWVPAFFGSAFNIFLLRQFFKSIPNDLVEAGRIDGCGEFQIFFKLMLPLSRPILTVIGLFHFMYAWNDFMGPLIYLTDQNTFTLSLGLQSFQSQTGGTEWHLLMAASTMVILPIIVIFFFAQKTFIESITLSGTKG